MYCPNCGTKTKTDQNYCRACGLGLEKIASTLTEQLPARVDESLLARKDRLEKWGVVSLSVFAFGVISFLLYSVGMKLISQGNLLAVLGMVGLFIMMACGLASVILFAKAKDVGDKAKKRNSEVSESTSTKQLLTEGHFEPVPSVTDRTTELLVVEKRDTQRTRT